MIEYIMAAKNQIIIDFMKLPRRPVQFVRQTLSPNKTAVDEGIEEAIKETVKQKRRNTFKFYGLLNKSEGVILRIRNIIPIFTGEIVIDTAKVTLIHRPFFFSERIHSISVKDISDVYIETVPFLATIYIVDTGFADVTAPENTTVKIRWLWKRDAERARRIITGLMESVKEEVDLKNLDEEGLFERLEEIGKVREAHTTVTEA